LRQNRGPLRQGGGITDGFESLIDQAQPGLRLAQMAQAVPEPIQARRVAEIERERGCVAGLGFGKATERSEAFARESSPG
jgi:hypothetical protein